MSIKPSALMERLIAGITLTIAFLVMASVFAPDQSQAGNGETRDHGMTGHSPDSKTAHHGETADEKSAEKSATHADSMSFSTNPHEGLRCLGSLESNGYLVQIYSTELGPRYSVYERRSGKELAVLLAPEKVAQHFPDLPLPSMDFSGPTHLMLADPGT